METRSKSTYNIVSPNGYFKIRVPITGDISLRIYNIAGVLVFRDDFLNQTDDSYVSGACGKGYYCWPKTNLSGVEVIHGVYYYVLRFKFNVLQSAPTIIYILQI